MSYMWKEFNIKTFRAETVVYRNGAYCPELSTLVSPDINQKYFLPVHIIYTGEIIGQRDLYININVDSQPVFLSVDIHSGQQGKLRILIKNAGKNSELRGHILIKNDCYFDLECDAEHIEENTGILLQTKLVAERNSISKLSARANIGQGIKNVISDIKFDALADKTARIEFLPAQHICSVPKSADHSASLWKPSEQQIIYLRSAGLSGAEVQDALRDAFMHDFTLF